jgi:hypothetical protein
MAEERSCTACGKSIEHRTIQAKTCEDCSYQRKVETSKAWAKRNPKRSGGSQSPQYIASIKSVTKGEHRVLKDGSNPKVKEVLCQACFGMSWRREIGKACACGEWNALEPAPERAEPLGSNMGTLVGQGRLYGYSGYGGSNHPKPNKSGRL